MRVARSHSGFDPRTRHVIVGVKTRLSTLETVYLGQVRLPNIACVIRMRRKKSVGPFYLPSGVCQVKSKIPHMG